MAAGLGFKDFTTGEVLTAADVDGYLMQGVWVFASAAARDAAVTSPQEGNFAYLKDTNVTTYYTGSAWANLDTTGMTNPMTTTGDTIYSSSGSTPARLGIGTAGQVLAVNSGATAPEWKTVGGSAFTKITSSTFSVSASSVAVDSVFSATYKNYRLIFTITSATASPARWGLEMRFRTGGSDNTTSNYRYSNIQYDWSSGAAEADKGEDVASAYITSLDNGLTQFVFDIINPFATNVTWVSGLPSNKTAGGFANFMFNGTTSFDGFKIECDQATALAGEYAVYGYGD
jgi:hypothetical protein